MEKKKKALIPKINKIKNTVVLHFLNVCIMCWPFIKCIKIIFISELT